MLDTQSLIHNAGMQPDFWAPARMVTRQEAETRPKPYLSICAIYRDEADYLAEWVEFHRLVGVERFFLYNNLSSDHHREVLAPYVDEGLVTVRDWPVTDGGRVRSRPTTTPEVAPLRLALDRVHRPRRVPLLAQRGAAARGAVGIRGVARAWRFAGRCSAPPGHKTKPPGLVIENYLRRIEVDNHINMKTVADPRGSHLRECARFPIPVPVRGR